MLASAALLSLIASLASGSDGCEAVGRRVSAALVTTSAPPLLWRLSRLGGAQTVEILARRLDEASPEHTLSLSVALGLSRHASALRRLVGRRPGSDSGRLGRALGLLALGDASATGTITEALETAEASTRRMAVAALAQMPAARPRALLFTLLDDPDPEVQLLAAEPHLRRRSRRARKALLALLDAPDPELRRRAGRALLEAGHRFAPEDLAGLPAALRPRAVAERHRSTRRLLTSADPSLRAGAFAAAVDDGTVRASALTAAAARNRRRDPSRADAELTMARVLGQFDPPEALVALPAEGRPAAVAVLTAFTASVRFGRGVTSGADGLAEVLDVWSADEGLSPRDEARFLDALSVLEPFPALEAARARLLEGDEILRSTSLRVIARTGRPRDVAALFEVADRGPPALQVAALEAAAEICSR